VDTKRISDPDAKKPDDWDEDAPYEILDEEAQKPEGWLDDEPSIIPDPGVYFPAFGLCLTLMYTTQMPKSRKSGMMRKMATGLLPLFQTPSVKRLLAAASGSGN